jgi:predicted nucleotidyltransferase
MCYTLTMGKALLGIFEIYRRSYEEACQKALEGAKYLYEQGVTKVFLFGSITKPEFFMRDSDIDIAVEGLSDVKRLTVEARLIDILYPYDFDLLVIDSKDIITRKEIVEAAIRDGICIKKS